ncbi:hypothetical protein [Agathobaculum sp.]|nr:hypothetical protein [Agathobaculum sp.]
MRKVRRNFLSGSNSLRTLCLDGIALPDDVEIISPEEYDNEYD